MPIVNNHSSELYLTTLQQRPLKTVCKTRKSGSQGGGGVETRIIKPSDRQIPQSFFLSFFLFTWNLHTGIRIIIRIIDLTPKVLVPYENN